MSDSIARLNAAFGAGEPEPVGLRSPSATLTPDSAWWVYRTLNTAADRGDLMALSTAPGSEPVVLVATDAAESQPAPSRDGRWFAYSSDIDGVRQVYVRPFPVASTRTRRGRMQARKARVVAAAGLAATALATLAAPVSAQAGRVVALTPPGPSLEGNLLGDNSRRTALVYLPPSHSEPDAGRFPVVYLLHAFGVGPESWRGGATGYENMDVAATLDSLVASGAAAEMIVVMPDARTRYGGSWYASSPAIGDWERYVALDLVDAVDASFRTLARREARAIVGQSMGAYGALRIASAHPEVFGVAAAVSAPNLVNPNPLGLAALEAALRVPSPHAVLEGSPLPAVMWSKAAAFSSDADAAPFFAALPVVADGDSLSLESAAWRAWERNTIRGLLNDPARQRALGRLDLRLEVGNRDPLRVETHSLAEALRALGIEAQVIEFDGGHVEGVRDHFTRSLLPWLSSRLAGSGAGR